MGMVMKKLIQVTMNSDFTKGISSKEDDGFPIIPTVEFTEDDWKSIYTGYCIEKSIYSYLVRSKVYGTFWIPKENVRLKLN